MDSTKSSFRQSVCWTRFGLALEQSDTVLDEPSPPLSALTPAKPPPASAIRMVTTVTISPPLLVGIGMRPPPSPPKPPPPRRSSIWAGSTWAFSLISTVSSRREWGTGHPVTTRHRRRLTLGRDG
jgi:hypothetical protein